TCRFFHAGAAHGVPRERVQNDAARGRVEDPGRRVPYAGPQPPRRREPTRRVLGADRAARLHPHILEAGVAEGPAERSRGEIVEVDRWYEEGVAPTQQAV